MDDTTLKETIAVYDASGHNAAETARKLGVGRTTIQRRIALAARQGLTGAPTTATPAGFNIDYVTRHTHDGEIRYVLSRLRPDTETYATTLEAIDEVIAQHVKDSIPTIPVPTVYGNENLATFYPIIDHHLGLYAWEPETGANYDLNIAQKILRDSLAELVGATPNSEQAVILNIGDFFHSDDNTNRTRRSGNILDADGRYAKILEIGIDLELYAIELALTKHQFITVRNLPGNHDPYASLALNAAIRMAFRDNPRVHVSRDPSPFYFWRFGKVLVGATHGDMIRHTDMPQVMAAYAAKDWGETEHRYVYLGHVHHKSIGGGEKFGATWETFRTLAPKDAWASQSGFASGRSMVAITHHRDYGEKYRNTVTIAGPGFKVR